ncbi:MAG: AtzE family amidohydrolase [Betaproteobacteria bacterium]|nr:AtzE family amidohydrolase [Betaproteobacteria bacterium]
MLAADAPVTEIAAAVRSGEVTALELTQATLKRVAALDPRLNCFTAVTAERALSEAAAVDGARAAGRDPGQLAGVPYAVKNLFDIAGLPTLAGSKINAERAPAASDAVLMQRLKAAGAVLIGALNMDEYAYGFTTENTHYGPTRNPHALDCIAGGSSGGSAAAVAGGLVPFTLGSDTNGSIRVPSSLCGVFGLKPTFGRLPRTGTFPFVASLDHLGPFGRCAKDLAVTYDAMQGTDANDAACVGRAIEPCLPELNRGSDGLRIAVAADYFESRASDDALEAVNIAASALKIKQRVTLPETARARAAAYLITASEGANLHLHNLRRRAQDFEPLSRDRFLAGALVPAAWYLQAQRFRHWYAQRVAALFVDVDVIIAPATPVTATPIGAETVTIAGETMPIRPNMGIFTQPISFIGLPVAAVPIHRTGRMPIGIQVIAAPWREDLCLRVAAALEAAGIARAPIAAL